MYGIVEFNVVGQKLYGGIAYHSTKERRSQGTWRSIVIYGLSMNGGKITK